jgi:hypothetical protein
MTMTDARPRDADRAEHGERTSDSREDEVAAGKSVRAGRPPAY